MNVRHRVLTTVLWGSVAALSAAAYAQRSAPEPPAASPTADNTKVNARDRSNATLTAFNQPNDAADRKLAADARKAIVDDKELSVMARNVKLVAIDGTVTLRGPVQTDAERIKVGQIVAKVSGVSNVDNQLDVKSQ
jgi:osmotically-inducible protein OsmY